MTLFDPPTDNTEVLADLHVRLEAAAAEAGLLELGYRIVDSPVGRLLVVAGDGGVVRVAFDIEDHDRVLDSLAATIGPRILRTPARLDPVARELDEYFAGRRQSFDVRLDLRLARGFRRSVLEALPDIGYGATASYSAVAAGVGNPRAVRAVGTACATNPLPVLLPCHRVVRSDGSVGAYRGGPAAKRVLLDLEAQPR